jgi:hypothetical protein
MYKRFLDELARVSGVLVLVFIEDIVRLNIHHEASVASVKLRRR